MFDFFNQLCQLSMLFCSNCVRSLLFGTQTRQRRRNVLFVLIATASVILLIVVSDTLRSRRKKRSSHNFLIATANVCVLPSVGSVTYPRFHKKHVAGATCSEIPQPNATVDWPTYGCLQCMACCLCLDTKHNCPLAPVPYFIVYQSELTNPVSEVWTVKCEQY